MNADIPSLSFPLLTPPAVGDGSAIAIQPGLLWLRMPVPGDLATINVWALADGDGWTLIDTGLRTAETMTAWRAALTGPLLDRPVRRVLATHMHPDHCGLAGWFATGWDARLWMTRTEYLILRVLAADTGQSPPSEAMAFYRAAGWDQDALDRYQAQFGDFGKSLYPPPPAFRRITDGEQVRIGDTDWTIILGEGHSPEHACLYSPDRKLFLSGDQVLPRISSNVSVHPLEPDADPLTDWLTSLRAIRGRVPDDVLVLPAHGLPFQGLHRRIDMLVQGHEGRLERALAALDTPQRAVDLFALLYRRPIGPETLGMATGEALAHLACLRRRGLARSFPCPDGITRWQRT